MAVYHFSAQVISRSQGRSSVAAAAYRASEKLVDERTGLVHDFTHKNDVLESDILLPKDAPEWMAEREQLWNSVEQTERRKDAQLAREINVALPRELAQAQNWALLKNFVQKEFVDHGMVADINFHSGHKGGEAQPHGHVMLTMREVTPEGFGPKVRAWNHRALLNDWREHWADYCNHKLARQGFDMRIDHRTLEAQGIHLEPQSKIGPKVAQSAMARYEEHQALAQRNGERLYQNPDIALTAITRQQSTFTHHDLARFVNRHTVDSEQFEQVYQKIKAHPDLVYLGLDEKRRERFTTREMLALETKMISQANDKSGQACHQSSKMVVQQAMSTKTLTSEQKVALSHVTQGQDIACVVGFAGTGKSYFLGVAKEAWEAEGFRVHGMALSGIAAENLEGGSGIQSRTAASHLWHWERDRERLTEKDIVVVDEAGMLGSRQMAKLLDETTRANAKLVLVGDPEQLQAIEAGGAFRAITKHVGHVDLSDIRRQKLDWQKQATRDFAQGRTEKGLEAYAAHDNMHTFSTKAAALKVMVEQWDEVRSQSPEKPQILLAYTRAEVKALNEEARAMRHAQGELGKNVLCETSRGERTFATHDRIYFLKNENRDLHVKNGTLGTIEKLEDTKLTVRLDSTEQSPSRRVEFNLKDYNDIDHGYAATVYKAQGITVERSHVLASKHFDRHSAYVALSRHKEGVDVYWGQDEFPSFERLAQTFGQHRSKDISLDYARNRGFESEVTQTKLQDLNEQTFYERFEKKLPGTPLSEKMPDISVKTAQEHRYEQLLQAALNHTPQELANVHTLSPKPGDFAAFKQQFEAERPGAAKVLQNAIRPAYEKEALAAEKYMLALEKKLSLNKYSNSRGEAELARYAAGVSKKTPVMGYLKEHNPQLSARIHRLTKIYERSLGHDIER